MYYLFGPFPKRRDEHKKSSETFAMKSLNKGWIVKNGQQDAIMNERNILLMKRKDRVGIRKNGKKHYATAT